MRASLADSIEVVSRANEERSLDGRGRGEGGFVEEIGGEDGEFAAGFQHGGGAGFGEEIESTVGGEGRGGVRPADLFLPVDLSGAGIPTGGQARLVDGVEFVAECEQRRPERGTFGGAPDDVGVRHIAVSVGANREQVGA